jgi:predicted component of type VI protein secretion system
MLVKLKVVSGSQAGKEIKVSLAKFFIGRGDDCHLRPQSDLISRHHCAIIVEDGQAIIRDLKSRNGTIVNGEKITGDVVLKMGDHLKVGPLEFEVAIDHGLGGAKKPKVADVKDAAARVAEPEKKKDDTIDDSISSWLEEADEEERSARISAPQTRQFKFDTGAMKAAADTAADPAAASTGDTGKQAAASSDTKATDKDKAAEKDKKKKKEYGKLPAISKEGSASSRDAAADMLKKFFNRR